MLNQPSSTFPVAMVTVYGTKGQNPKAFMAEIEKIVGNQDATIDSPGKVVGGVPEISLHYTRFSRSLCLHFQQLTIANGRQTRRITVAQFAQDSGLTPAEAKVA